MFLNKKIFILGLLCICFYPILAQHLHEVELQKSPTNNYTRWGANSIWRQGAFFNDELESNQLDPGQTGYVEFDFNYFTASDIEIGLRDANDVNRYWYFRFLNDEIFIDGQSYGLCTAGLKYRIERCDASIKFWADNQFLKEIVLPDINFTTLSVVKVGTAESVTGNLPRLSLEFPILQSCQANPPSTTSTTIYTDLKKHLDGSFVEVRTPVLNFRYDEHYAIVPGENATLDYIIYDWNKGTPNQSGSLLKTMGTNYFKIPLSSVAVNTYYTLEVSEAKGQKSYLRFLYYCPPGQNCITPGGGNLQEDGPRPDQAIPILSTD